MEIADPNFLVKKPKKERSPAQKAAQEKAFAALVELQWFIAEQVEEERTARDIVSKFELVKDDPSALLDLDRELGSRQPSADPSADASADA